MDGGEKLIVRLFVYGTLQPGRLRWPFLAPYTTGHRPALAAGRIYDTGNGWPVAVFGTSEHLVPGTVVDLDSPRVDEALSVLDDVEATATDLLRRVVVTTTAGVRAWTYHCDELPPGATRIARWQGVDER